MLAGSWQFRPKPLIVALYLVVGVSMLLLGRWQLNRAVEKIEFSGQSERAKSAQAVSLPTLQPLANDGELERYTRVSITGTTIMDLQFLWDNRIHSGQAGYEVIVPVELEDGRLALVNRGWVPVGLSRSELPDVAGSSSRVHLEGILTYPSKGFSSGNALSQIRNQWPRVIQYMDYNAIEAELERPLIEGLVQGVSTPADNPLVLDKPSTEVQPVAPFLYVDNWKPVANGPEKHYGYAFQWFAMFIALTVLFAWLNLSRNLQNPSI